MVCVASGSADGALPTRPRKPSPRVRGHQRPGRGARLRRRRRRRRLAGVRCCNGNRARPLFGQQAGWGTRRGAAWPAYFLGRCKRFRGLGPRFLRGFPAGRGRRPGEGDERSGEESALPTRAGVASCWRRGAPQPGAAPAGPSLGGPRLPGSLRLPLSPAGGVSGKPRGEGAGEGEVTGKRGRRGARWEFGNFFGSAGLSASFLRRSSSFVAVHRRLPHPIPSHHHEHHT